MVGCSCGFVAPLSPGTQQAPFCWMSTPREQGRACMKQYLGPKIHVNGLVSPGAHFINIVEFLLGTGFVRNSSGPAGNVPVCFIKKMQFPFWHQAMHRLYVPPRFKNTHVLQGIASQTTPCSQTCRILANAGFQNQEQSRNIWHMSHAWASSSLLSSMSRNSDQSAYNNASHAVYNAQMGMTRHMILSWVESIIFYTCMMVYVWKTCMLLCVSMR